MSMTQIGTEFRVREPYKTRKNGKTYQYAVFECFCGNRIATRVASGKKNKSCGCDKNKQLIERATKHGQYNNRLFRTWLGMKSRCLDPKHRSYQHYGALGVTICDSWMEFENFYNDIGEKIEGFTLDRIDNSKGYCKENCRWATWKQQNRNTSQNVILTIDGVSKTMVEWSESENAATYSTISNRLKRGWDHKSAVFKPVK